MGRRLALIIGNSIFRDPSLARLLTPDADVGALADVLLSPEIGAFDDVKLVVNMAAASIRRSISEFFSNKTRDDLLLLYFSGHGVLDENGRLYLATKETERDYLRGTAIPAVFITDEMDHSRSRRQVLVLDCCHSGAFARGSKGAPGASVGTATAFEGKGYGRVVLTASDATQYAWEGDQVIGEADNSVFTHYLVQGLQTGKADVDGDGEITVDELYDYVYEQVISQTPKQTPGKWSYREQGEIVLARAPAGAPPQVEDIQLPEFAEEIETKLKRLYDTGLAAFWLDDWDRATRAFQAILDARPDYPGALEKLREARRNAELARLYQTAQDARQAQDWDAAVSALEALLAQAADYRDATSQLQSARQRARLAALYVEARRLREAGEWYAARRVLASIAESDPDYPDEDGLHALVEENIAALERQKQLEDLYSQALARIDAGQLDEARGLLTQVQEFEPGYAESEALLAKVESLLQREAEERRRQEEIDALYRKAQDLARSKQWPEVLLKMEALRRLLPEFEDPDDLLTIAQRQVELAEQQSRRGQEVSPPLPAPGDRSQEAPRESAQPVGVTQPWYAQTITYLREHVWLTFGASVFIVLMVLAGFNAGRIFPVAPFVASERIAFVSNRDGNLEIYVMNIDGSELMRLTNNSADEFWPAWSPDGTRIAFASTRDGNLEIYVMNADGSGQVRLTNNPADDFHPFWSPDGRRIGFGSHRGGNAEIYVMNADGSELTRLTNNAVHDDEPDWSPDGTRIAFVSDLAGNLEIYVRKIATSASAPPTVMNADGAQQTRLTNNSADDVLPAWSPDGTRLAFASERDGNREIYTMNADGSGPVRLTDNPAVDDWPAWSPDGTRIAFTSERQGFDIYIMNADGSSVSPLTSNPMDDLWPAWQPR